MLNEKGQRELAYIVEIDGIQPIEGADRVEVALVGGWRIMVKKNQFKPGDLAVYFEIDSKVPEKGSSSSTSGTRIPDRNWWSMMGLF